MVAEGTFEDGDSLHSKINKLVNSNSTIRQFEEDGFADRCTFSARMLRNQPMISTTTKGD